MKEDLFLIYDFPHIFKNVRNNWFTEALKEIEFTVDGHEYLAWWSDIVNRYEDDRQNSLRLTLNVKVFPWFTNCFLMKKP